MCLFVHRQFVDAEGTIARGVAIHSILALHGLLKHIAMIEEVILAIELMQVGVVITVVGAQTAETAFIGHILTTVFP